MFIGIDNSVTGVGSISPLAMALGATTFYAPLTSSLALSKGTGSATFTRATTATVMGYAATALPGDSQVLLTVAANEARFEGARRIGANNWSSLFADGTPIPDATLKGVLIEEARTNLAIYSNTFNNATGWTQGGGLPTLAQNVTGPDGAASGWTLTEGTVNNLQGYSSTQTITIGGTYSFSVFAKAKTAGRYLVIAGTGIGVANEVPIFDLSAGTVSLAGTTTIVKSASIVPVGTAGWYRCSCTVVAATTGGITLGMSKTPTDHTSNTYFYLGDGTSGILIYGGQME